MSRGKTKNTIIFLSHRLAQMFRRIPPRAGPYLVVRGRLAEEGESRRATLLLCLKPASGGRMAGEIPIPVCANLPVGRQIQHDRGSVSQKFSNKRVQ
jgi:hypothetical protein